jgi:hypothetical protein
MLFPFCPWFVAFLFVDSESPLHLAIYGTLWVPLGALFSSFFKVVSSHWAVRMSIIHNLHLFPHLTFAKF